MLRFLEITWLFISFLAFVAAAYNWFSRGFSDSYILFAISAISLLMFFYRRNLRKSKED
jgi:hypothetical protein